MKVVQASQPNDTVTIILRDYGYGNGHNPTWIVTPMRIILDRD